MSLGQPPVETGAQYRVYHDDSDWVRKELLTPEESRAVVAGWYAPGEAPPEALAYNYQQFALEGCKRVQELLATHPELRDTFGNPVIYANGCYRQRKHQTMHQALETLGPAQKRKAIDNYVEHVMTLWRYGIAETTFNCTVNHGLTRDLRVVLFDFGEITTNKYEVAEAIGTKRWLQAYSYRHLPDDIRSYYRERLTGSLTLHELHTRWGTAQSV